LQRLRPDGSVSPAFVPQDAGTPSPDFNSVIVQDDAKVIVCGVIGLPAGRWARLVRLNPDGSVDETFTPFHSNSVNLFKIVRQADGRIVAKAEELNADNIARTWLMRFLPDGAVDPSFEWRADANLAADDFALQSDGKVIVCRAAPVPDGAGPRLARVHADGSPDAGFTPTAAMNAGVNTVAAQRDGQILAAVFTPTEAPRVHTVVRLWPDGSVDKSFNFEPNFSGYPFIKVLLPQPDGQILVAGGFSDPNVTRPRSILRLNGNDDRRLVNLSMAGKRFQACVWTRLGRRYIVEASAKAKGSIWTPLRTLTGSGNQQAFAHETADETSCFYRLRIEE
jgi:uncharacterized delta-60 repeat protein